jgi:hypothetical protein
MISVRVYGILIYQNKLLVSDEFIRGDYFTKFPGGGLEFGEGTKECLVREFKEETGLDVSVGNHLYTTDFYQQSAFNKAQQILSIYYFVFCDNVSSLPTHTTPFNFLPHQVEDKTSCAEVFRWINLNELTPNHVHLPIDKIVVEKIIAQHKEVNSLVKAYNLLPHPEGGFYKETYRSEMKIDKANATLLGFAEAKNCSTAIYFLLTANNFSAFHKIKSDELWHFYKGNVLHIHMISPLGEYSIIKLGNNIANGEQLQAVVPAHYWFASEVATGGNFAFVGCTVAPGFDFADFEMPEKDTFLKQFPQHAIVINKLCR